MNGETRKLKRTVNREPTSLRFALLADRYRTSGEIEKAIRACQTGLAWHPTYATGYWVLAQCYADRGLVEETREALTDALRFAPDRFVVLKQLADILKAQGNRVQALSYYRRAFAIDPLNESIRSEITTLAAQQPTVQQPQQPQQPTIESVPTSPLPNQEGTTAAWGAWIADLFHSVLPQDDTVLDGETLDPMTLWPRPAFEALLALAEEPSVSLEAPVPEPVALPPDEGTLTPPPEPAEPVASILEEITTVSDHPIDELSPASMDEPMVESPEAESAPDRAEVQSVPELPVAGPEEMPEAGPPVPETPVAAPAASRPSVPLADHYLDQFFPGEDITPADGPHEPVQAVTGPANLGIKPTGVAAKTTAAPVSRTADDESGWDNGLPSDVIPTATLAELYVRQGLIDRAIAVYLTLIENDPANSDIHNRLSELFVLKAQQDNASAS